MKKFNLKINFGWKELILVGIFAILVATDLITKYLEEAQGWNFIFIPNLIEVESGHRNSGAAFSMLASAEWGQTLLVVSTSVMMLALVVAFLLLPNKFFILKIAIVLILSGAIGNFVDRIAFGEVRDFVWVNMLFLNDWAIFPLTKSAKLAQQSKANKQDAQQTDDNEYVVGDDDDGR